MIVGSQEWSEVQPIDWRQITSLSLSLFVSAFVSLPLSRPFSASLVLIWCNGNTSKRSLACRTVGCTLSSVYTGTRLQRAGINTHTHSHEMRISKQTVPLPALEWLLTHNLDLESHKGYPLPDTYHLDKSLQIYKWPKVSIKDNHKTIWLKEKPHTIQYHRNVLK